jgi:hypothetical protein
VRELPSHRDFVGTRRTLSADATPGKKAVLGSVGDCYDNSMIESFWSRMQVVLLDRKEWKTGVEPVEAIFDYLDIWHNRRGPAQPARDAYADRVRAPEHHHRGMKIQIHDSPEPVAGQRLRRPRAVQRRWSSV